MDHNIDLFSAAECFFKAYNKLDTNYLEGALSEDVHWKFQNRSEGSGRVKLLQSMSSVAITVPNRYFAEPKRWAVNGQVVYFEHLWSGTPAVDLDAYGLKKGLATSKDVVSVLVFTGSGKIAEWCDYA